LARRGSKRVGSAALQGNTSMTLNKWVVERIREKILQGSYAPGETLTESRLMEELDVGRTPVREALLQLEVEGLVTIFPRKGARVNKTSLKEVEEMYTIGGTLEGLAAALSVPRINNKTLNQLSQRIQEGQRLQEDNDIVAYCKVNAEFHRSLVAHCENEKLINMIAGLRRSVHRLGVISFTIPGRIRSSVEEHQRILTSIKEGDSEAVRKAVEDHWNNTKERLIKYLKDFSILSHL
jgi:DNA-binding GntR family transcriptional regulator